MISVFSNEKKIGINDAYIRSVQRQWIIKYGTHYNMTIQFFGDLTIKTRALILWSKKSLDLLCWPLLYDIDQKIRKHADVCTPGWPLNGQSSIQKFQSDNPLFGRKFNSFLFLCLPCCPATRTNVFEKFPFKWTLQLSSQNLEIKRLHSSSGHQPEVNRSSTICIYYT